MEQLDIPNTNKNVPTTLARCEDEEKQCLSGIKAYNIQAHPNFRAISFSKLRSLTGIVTDTVSRKVIPLFHSKQTLNLIPIG